MEIMKIFAYNLKKYRKKRELTQEKLAEIIDTATSYIGGLEINIGTPSMEMVEKIAKARDIEPFRLFVNDNERLKNEDDVSDYLESLTTIERQNLLERILNLISDDLKKILEP
jgi:transcriptional regulator with XRE-family HTH domain